MKKLTIQISIRAFEKIKQLAKAEGTTTPTWCKDAALARLKAFEAAQPVPVEKPAQSSDALTVTFLEPLPASASSAEAK